MAEMMQDKRARVIEILPHVEQWQGGFDRDTQSFWIEVPTKADGKARLCFTEGALATLVDMLGAMKRHIEPRDR